MHDDRLHSADPDQTEPEHAAFGEHEVQHHDRDPPAILGHVMPGQEQSHGQRGQQEILSEAEHVERLAQPNIGAISDGLRSEQ